MQLIADAMNDVRTSGKTVASIARRVIDDGRAGHRRLPGIGHRTHSRDPRTEGLFTLARTGGMAGDGIAFMLERVAGEAIKPLPINVDGAIAAILYDLVFPPPLGKLSLIIGRRAGLSAQVLEEYTREREEEVVDWYVEEDRIAEWATETHVLSRRLMRIEIPVTYDGPAPRDLADTAHRTQGAHTT
jgi:citrate synthase